MSGLLALQVIAMGVMCGFYRPMPLIFPSAPSFSGQGCIAGPKYSLREVVGIYWVLPTVLYTASLALAFISEEPDNAHDSTDLSVIDHVEWLARHHPGTRGICREQRP